MSIHKAMGILCNNITKLIRFLVSRWKSHYSINEMEVNVAYDTFSVNLRPNDESQLKPELSNNHEEADTCMLLLAKQIRDTKI